MRSTFKVSLAVLLFALSVWLMAPHHVHAVTANNDDDAETTSVGGQPLSADRCETIKQSALDQCKHLMEETWYDGGAINYLRSDRIRDYPRCEQLSSNLYTVCSSQ